MGPLSYLSDQLQNICAQHPVEPKWIIVPSKQVGYNIATALTLQSVSWVNLRFVTAMDRALELSGNDPANLITRDQAMLAVRNVLQGNSVLARRLVGDVDISAGVAATIYRSLRALRLSQASEFSGRPKHPLHELNRMFESRLADAGKYDERILFREALGRMASARKTEKCWVLDDTRLSPLAATLVQGLSDRVLRVGAGEITTEVPRWAAARISTGWMSPTDVSREVDTSAIDKQGPKEQIHFIAADDPASEVAGVLRAIRRRGLQYGDAEIVYTDYRKYIPLIHAAARDIPATYAGGYPARFTPAGQTFNALLRWIESDWKREQLVDFLQLQGAEFPLARVSATRVAEYALVQRLSSGHAEAVEMLARLGAGEARPSGQGDLFERPSRPEAVALTRLYGLITPSSSWSQFLAAAQKFLKRHCKVRSGADGIAIDSISERLELLSPMPFQGTVPEFARFVRTLFEDHAIEASVARGDALNVVPVERAGFGGKMYTFFVGLDDETFPAASVSGNTNLSGGEELDWIVTSKSDARWILTRALERCPGEKYLIARRFDPLEGGKVEATPLLALLQKKAKHSVTENWGTRADPAEATSEAEYVLGLRRGAGEIAASAFPQISSGLLLDRTRQVFNEYEGKASSIDLGLSDGKRKYSTSALETLAKCPYQFFLKHVLRIARPLDEQDNTFGWLTPMQRGLLLHELYFDFTNHIAKLGEGVNYERHKPVMDHMLSSLLDKQRRLIPAKSTAAYSFESRMLQISADIFLQSLADDPNLNPVGFEWEFGYDRDVVVNFPGELSLNLRGKIDRIDETEEGYIVWDYKTGVDRYTPGNLLANGQNLQWLLYGYAFDAAEQRKKKTIRGGYWMASEKGGGVKYDDVLPDKSEVSKLLFPLMQLADAGLFAHVSQAQIGEKPPCRFCDYKRVCSDEVIHRKEFGMQPGQSIETYQLVGSWLSATLAT